jgi:hypothetical protein
VIRKEDWKKVQHVYASPAIHSETDVQRFIQTVLESKNKRDYVLVNLLACGSAKLFHYTKRIQNSKEVDIR